MQRQDALTSEQVTPIRSRSSALPCPAGWFVMWTWLLLGLTGCTLSDRAAQLQGPYEQRQLFAVAPLANESGSAFADGVKLADRLSAQLTVAGRIDTVPVNRVLAAMDQLGYPAVGNKTQALRLRQMLGVDGLLVGTITGYDPYDPPKLGLNVELYLDPQHASTPFDVRLLSRAASDRDFRIDGLRDSDQPVTALSTYFDAASPWVQDAVQRYAVHRGTDYGVTSADVRLYRISTDLYTDFVAFEVSRRLLIAESQRLGQRPVPANRDNQP